MNEYQITVSLDGFFLFRTEWDDTETRVRTAAMAITTNMAACQVRVISRLKSMSDETTKFITVKPPVNT